MGEVGGGWYCGEEFCFEENVVVGGGIEGGCGIELGCVVEVCCVEVL